MSHIHINFEHVNYSYEKTVPILQDITFTAHENDSIGLIGANGVGKSTLLKLLVGLNPDYEGSIRVEAVSYTHLDLFRVALQAYFFYRKRKGGEHYAYG